MLGGSSLGRQLGLTFGSVLGRQIALGACRDDQDGDFERRPFVARVPLASLPPAVDLRPWMTAVEEQGALGSCTANALVGAMEYLAYRESGSRVDLSRLFVYYNQRLWDGAVRGDIGARVSDGVRVLARVGVATERSWPYERGLFAVQPPEPLYVESKRYRALDWWSVPVDADAFRACLASGFPVAFGTRVTESFLRAPRSGSIPMPGAGDREDARHGRHALLLCGYDDVARAFIVRNSWGADWGDLGYCYVPYAYLGNPAWTRNCWSIRLAAGEHDPAQKPAVALHAMPSAPPSSGMGAGGGAAQVVGSVAGAGAEIALRMVTGSGLIAGLVGGLVSGITPGVAAGISGLRGRDPGALAGPDRSEAIMAALRAGGAPAPILEHLPWDDGLDERAARERASVMRHVQPGAPEPRARVAAFGSDVGRSVHTPNRADEAPPVAALPGTPSVVVPTGKPSVVPTAKPSVVPSGTPSVVPNVVPLGTPNVVRSARPNVGPVITSRSPAAPGLGAVEGASIPEALLRVWHEHGGAAGPLGAAVPPVGVMHEGTERGVVLELRGGGIFDWDGDAAPFVLRASDHLFSRWLASGAARSPCGWPASAPVSSGAARVLSCTRGAIVEHPRHGTFSVQGALFAEWRERGGLDGPLGAPIAEAEATGDPGRTTQRFERGALAWSPTQGVTNAS